MSGIRLMTRPANADGIRQTDILTSYNSNEDSRAAGTGASPTEKHKCEREEKKRERWDGGEAYVKGRRGRKEKRE